MTAPAPPQRGFDPEAEQEVDFAADLIRRKVEKLRELSPLWEMYKDGVDLNSVQWAAH